MRIPIAPEGVPIIKWVLFAWLLSLLTIDTTIIAIFSIISIFVMSFFRDPLRNIQRNERTVYAAADGKITQINDVDIDGTPYYQIVTFLSVFNCHVNRIPLAGKIIKTDHIPGKFLAAMRGDIDKKNERQEHEETLKRTFELTNKWTNKQADQRANENKQHGFTTKM